MGKCDKCDWLMSVGETERFYAADNGFVQVYAECQACGTENHFVFNKLEWKVLIRGYEEFLDWVDGKAAVFAFDLEGIEGVDDFMLYAGRFAPFEASKKCGCGKCGR